MQKTKKNLLSLKTSGDRQVLIAILVSSIILLSFLVAVFTIPRPTIPIFPLWFLGEKREIPAPTMNISLGNRYSLFVGGQNLMGVTEYCTLIVKLRNMASPLPFAGNSSVPARASPLPSIMNFAFALRNNETWETEFTFTIFGQENPIENSITVDSLNINGAFYNVVLESFSDADSGFLCQFFFELWLRDGSQVTPAFSGVWVSSPILRIGE